MIKAIKENVYERMKIEKLSFFEALKYELYMMFFVMGIKLYVKYHNGTAVEGVDFFTISK